MKTKLILSLSIFIAAISLNGYSQCSVAYPGTGACTGCTNNPTGSINLSTNNQTVCYSGTSTISTLTINGNNVTVYICGNITITNYAGNGTSDVVVVNPGKTLTITNQPGNFYSAPKFVNYGTFNSSAAWSNFYGGTLITAASTATTTISADVTLNGGAIYMIGGFMNISGTITLNSGSTVCLQSNAILNTVSIINNANSVVSVAAGNSACVSYTGNAKITTNYFSSSILNVCAGPSVTGTSATSSAWGPNTLVTSGCNTQSCAILLPMILGNFSATQAGTKVILNWSTYSEQNSKTFEIQRSNNQIDFTTIGAVAASGNSAQMKDYSFTDYSPINGNNFYRLKLIADDGNYSYSPVQQIDIAPPSLMKVIVNKSQNNIQIIMPKGAENSIVRLLDMTGRVLKTVSSSGSQQSITVETSYLHSGIYIIELISPQIHQSKQFYFSAN